MFVPQMQTDKRCKAVKDRTQTGIVAGIEGVAQGQKLGNRRVAVG